MECNSAQRRALVRLLRARGYSTNAFGSIADLIDGLGYIEEGCVLLDLDFEQESLACAYRVLHDERPDLLIIGMVSSSSIREAVQAIKNGAMDVIERPLSEALLMQMLVQAADKLPSHSQHALQTRMARDIVASLTAREFEVLERLLNGMSNKMIASDLAITVRTVEMHRANILSKFRTKSLASLARIAVLGGVGRGPMSDAAA